MSTKSKVRKKAREWMQKEREQRKIIASRARDEGREDMRRDGRTLFPSKQRVYINAEGGIEVSSVVETFPSPYLEVPNYRVPFPNIGVPNYQDLIRYEMAMHSVQEMFLNFRPVEHAFRKRIGNSSTELRWFSWEPDRGNEECEEHTKALFHGMGKLKHVQRTLESITSFWYGLNPCLCSNCGHHMTVPIHYAELQRSAELLKECTDELRLRLGKVAPVPEREENYGRPL